MTDPLTEDDADLADTKLHKIAVELDELLRCCNARMHFRYIQEAMIAAFRLGRTSLGRRKKA